MKKHYSAIQIVEIIVATICMFGPKFIAPPAGLSPAGFQVFGILLGGLLLWLGVAVDWPSLYVLFALMTVPGLTPKSVIAGSYGNDTAVFLVFCFMMSACLTKSGLARRLAIWFLTNKLSRKSPWWTITMYFTAAFLINTCLSSTAGIMIFLPILSEMLVEIGCVKGKPEPLTAMMMMGTVIVMQAANAATPIAHAMSLQGMSTYNAMTGNNLDFFTFIATLLPLGILSVVVWFIISKFIWRPNVDKLKNVDFDRLAASCGEMTKREKWSAVVFALCIIFWLLPGLGKYIPALSIFSGVNQCFPPMIAMFVMNIIPAEDGEPVLLFADGVKNVNWNMFMFLGSIMSLGSALSNKDIGVSDWLSIVLGPVVQGISPTVFMIIMVMFAILFTNLVSNAVVLGVTFAIAMPLCTGVFGDSISIVALALLLTHSSQLALATPPSTPAAGVAASSGWVDTPTMLKWGFIYAIIGGALLCLVGIPYANLICG